MKSRKSFFIFCTIIIILLTLSNCVKKEDIYTIGIVEFADNPSTSDAEKGFIDAFKDAGLVIDQDVKFKIANAQGDFSSTTLIVKNFLNSNVDMFFALATPCLQACINSETDKPVIFTRVANPFLVGVVEGVDEQQQNVTGISTRSAFQQTIAIIKQLMPKIKVIGTVWSPSEINSEYYLELQKEFAEAAGWEVKSVPINSSSEMKIAVQSLVNEGIDCFYQLFDNLTSLGLESEISIANEEKIPLFSNVISDVFRGAAVSVGWDWYDSGYKAGEIAVQVYHGQKPNEIPIENMKNVKIYINKTAADIQGLKISDEFLKSADKVIQ